MSKISIRKQIEEIKKRSDEVISKGNHSNEIILLINSMLTILDVVVTVLLEKKVRKNSSNSGLPPSQGFGSNGNRNKKNDQDQGQKGERLGNSRTSKEEILLASDKCSNCKADLKDAKIIKNDERKKIDIIYEIQETTYRADTKECPECGERNKAEFPDGIDGKIQYGDGIKASIINFLMVQMISLIRVQEHFRGLTGRSISRSVMLKYIEHFAEFLKEWENKMIDKILQCPVIYVDETSMRVNGKNYWVHTYGAGDITLQFVHPSRGVEAIEDIGILPRYKGIIVHDCWGPYFSYEGVENVLHALCLAHLLRELNFIEESTGHKWAIDLKKLLKKAIENVSKSPERVLEDKKYIKLQNMYQYILFQALDEMPPFPKSNGKRGRPKQTDEQNLWERLVNLESSVLMFARVKEVDATNNRAERDLRINKLKKKVSGCFRTPNFASNFCRILSYTKTMRYRGYSSLNAISLALNGNIPPP